MTDNPGIDAVEQRMLQDRLDAAREGAIRARAAHIVITIASLALLVALWNTYASWYGRYAKAPTNPGGNVQKIQEDILARWVATQWVSVGPLGIQVGASDLGIWGSIGLAVISIWFFLAVRRENHIVARLIADVSKYPTNVQRYIFHGLVSRQIFVTVTGEDVPIENPNAPEIRTEQMRKENPEPAEKGLSLIQQLAQLFVRGGIKILHYFPPITAIFIFLVDLKSLITTAEYRGQEVLLWQTLNRDDKVQAIAMLTFSLFSIVGLSVVSYGIGNFREATRKIMQGFWVRILEEEEKRKVKGMSG